MKPGTLAALTRQAEEYMDRTPNVPESKYDTELKAFISGASLYEERVEQLEALINNPEIEEFLKGVQNRTSSPDRKMGRSKRPTSGAFYTCGQ